MKHVEAYLYDAAGHDEQIAFDTVNVANLGAKKLLWVDLQKRDEELLEGVAAKLKICDVPYKKIIDNSRAPEIETYGEFFRFCVDSVVTESGDPPKKLKIDFIVGKNFVLTIHDNKVDYFHELRERDQGETRMGEMDAESFTATLLDLNIVTYFKALNEIDRRIDRFDELVLEKDFETEEFLKRMVGLRRDVSTLRRWLTPHRAVYYSLSRADFQPIAESDSAEEYKVLNQHFEGAVAAVEHAREAVIGVFDFYATKSAQTTNVLIRRLTFFTLIVGFMAVVAGVFGMNYQLSYFEQEQGFWVTVIGMAFAAVLITTVAWFKRWI